LNEGVTAFEHILVGSSKVAKNLELLKDHNITSVLNLTDTVKNHFEVDGEFTYKRVPVEDSENVSISQHFRDCITFIEDSIKQGGKILIHCKLGQSRSPTVAIAFAMSHFNMTLKEAYETYYKIAGSEHLKINDGFLRQLMNWDQTLYNETSINLLTKAAKPIIDFKDMSFSEESSMTEFSFHMIEPQVIKKKSPKRKNKPGKGKKTEGSPPKKRRTSEDSDSEASPSKKHKKTKKPKAPKKASTTLKSKSQTLKTKFYNFASH
jgi:protein-tyrosine phosphatase